MKIKNITLLLLSPILFALTSCSDDDLNPTSVFEDAKKNAQEQEQAKNEFDKWLETNYRAPYNIEFNYRYNDKLSDLTYNVAPADMEHSIALAKLVKHMWIESYVELLASTSLRPMFPASFSFREPMSTVLTVTSS
jgi:substrate import-associated zinc metallohydrolase lipoprotein